MSCLQYFFERETPAFLLGIRLYLVIIAFILTMLTCFSEDDKP